ncbi:uncharacterized protein LOC128092661 [Culex pipiens pallens]|uniref:uncharacterized protein LOC128092661 n=1 Tax=Culex pipiens pallens TaxID=42434 RepID=UPI0022AB1845|nr:uncharacterized protein LOC128092661 [Culex pipiens pallens]
MRDLEALDLNAAGGHNGTRAPIEGVLDSHARNLNLIEPQERANVQLSKKTAQLHQMIQRATAYGTMVVEEIGKAAEGCRTKRNRVLEVHAMVQGFHSRMLEMLEPLGQVNGHL